MFGTNVFHDFITRKKRMRRLSRRLSKKLKHHCRHVKSVIRLLSRRRVLMIMSFFAALCFAFADSTTSLLFSDDSVRIKRDIGSPMPTVDHDSTSKAQCPYESRKLGTFLVLLKLIVKNRWQCGSSPMAPLSPLLT